MSLVVERVSALGGLDLVHAHFRGKATPPHSHPEAEIGVVLSGQRLVRCRGRTYPAPAGSVVIFRPGEIHAGAPADGDGSTYRAFLIPSATLNLSSAWQPDSDRDALPWFDAPVVADAALARALAESHAALEAGGGGPELETRLRGQLDTLARRHHGFHRGLRRRANRRPQPGGLGRRWRRRIAARLCGVGGDLGLGGAIGLAAKSIALKSGLASATAPGSCPCAPNPSTCGTAGPFSKPPRSPCGS